MLETVFSHLKGFLELTNTAIAATSFPGLFSAIYHIYHSRRDLRLVLRDRSFFTRYGGLVGFRGGSPKKKREKGGHVKYFSSALRGDTCYYS